MKKILYLISIMILLCVCNTSVYANDPTVELKINSSSNLVEVGDKVTLKVELIKVTDTEGIIAIGGVLQYNKEEFKISKIRSINGWNDVTYNEDNGKFILTNNNFVQSGEIIEIIFKAEKKANSSKIAITDLDISDGENSIVHDELNTNIQVEQTKNSLSSITSSPMMLKIIVIVAIVLAVAGLIAFVVIYIRKNM